MTVKYDVKQVEELAGRGLTRHQIAAALGMCPATLYNRQNDDPEFAKALERGKAQTIAMVAGKLMDQVNEDNLAAIIFYLKSQAGWSEKQNIELTGKDGNAIEVNHHGIEALSTEALLEIARMNDKDEQNTKQD